MRDFGSIRTENHPFELKRAESDSQRGLHTIAHKKTVHPTRTLKGLLLMLLQVAVE